MGWMSQDHSFTRSNEISVSRFLTGDAGEEKTGLDGCLDGRFFYGRRLEKHPPKWTHIQVLKTMTKANYQKKQRPTRHSEISVHLRVAVLLPRGL
jgi:hypothetical protein